MKIKKFQIDHYGPLDRTIYDNLGRFNLFFGPNESGKSLAIDALVKLLLGKQAKDFTDINRVSQTPEGFVVLDIKGKEIKLSGKTTLTDKTDLTAEQAENIFIIRNSELSIAKELGFYTSVTDQLTGLKTDQIKSVIDILLQKGLITPITGQFSNTQKDSKLRDRMAYAKNLLKTIKQLNENIAENQAEALEEKWFSSKIDFKQTKKQKEQLDQARKRTKYQSAKQALTDYRKIKNQLGQLDKFNQKQTQQWRDLSRDLDKLNEEKKQLSNQIKHLSAKLDQTEKKFKQVDRKIQTAQQRQEEIVKIENYLKRAKSLSQNLAKLNSVNQLATGGVGIGSLLLAALFWSGSQLFAGLILALIIFCLSSGIKLFIAFQKGQLNRLLRQLQLSVEQYRQTGNSLGEIGRAVEKINENYRQIQLKGKDLKTKKEVLTRQVNNRRQEKDKRNDQIDQVKDKISQLQQTTGQRTWLDYQKQVDKKNKLQTKLAQISQKLETIFNSHPQNSQNPVDFWQSKISQWKEFKQAAKGIKYTEAAVKAITAKIDKLETCIEKIANQIEHYQEKVNEIGGEANKILDSELDHQLHADAIADLPVIENQLKKFRRTHLDRKKAAWQAIKVFNKISQEEKSKVGELFGKKSLVSKYFNEITEGKYSQVFFDQENNRISVEENQGNIYEAGKLSGGAYDQLYLAIRLALGKKLLGDKKGFFVMDDPFIKADWQRLPKLLNILKDIAASGWQIIYFSTKQEVKAFLAKDISSDKIKFWEI